LAGFAFSAVAGAILLHAFPPLEAVPLMMACSVGVQAANLWALRRNIQWKGSLFLIIGGLLGIPIALYILQHADTQSFRAGFGVILVVYASYTLCRPTLTQLRQMESQSRNALVGFGGGLIGGLTAMPGALPNLVRYARHAEEPTTRPGPAVHCRDADFRACAYAFAPHPVAKILDRLCHQSAGLGGRSGTWHPRISQRQRDCVQTHHSHRFAFFGAVPRHLIRMRRRRAA
jgi:hypothetical protein